MLRRMKGFCEPDVYNELRVKYDFSSFEIFRKNRNRGDIELDSQLPDQNVVTLVVELQLICCQTRL